MQFMSPVLSLICHFITSPIRPISRFVSISLALLLALGISAAHAQRVSDLFEKPPRGPLAPKENIFAPTNLVEAPNRLAPEPVLSTLIEPLMDEFRRGGLVIFMHHTEATAGNDEMVQPQWWKDCARTKRLTNVGIATAVGIGNAIKRMRIPVSEVRTSQYCRNLDTGAFISIGLPRASAALNAMEAQQSESKSAEAVANGLRDQFLSVPAEGTSTIFVGHAMPVEATPDPALAGLGPGDAVILRRQGNGTFSFVTRLRPGQWEFLAQYDEFQRIKVARAWREAQEALDETREALFRASLRMTAEPAPWLAPDTKLELNGSALLAALRRGGYVLFMRHPEATVGIDANFDVVPGWPQQCELQRNLSERGKQDARAVGNYLRAAKVPISTVISSQYCRARETARLLGFSQVDQRPEWNFQVNQPPVANAAALRLATLAKPPRTGSNTLIVSHFHPKTNEQDAPLSSAALGEVLVFRPAGTRTFFVGRIPLEDWPKLSEL